MTDRKRWRWRALIHGVSEVQPLAVGSACGWCAGQGMAMLLGRAHFTAWDGTLGMLEAALLALSTFARWSIDRHDRIVLREQIADMVEVARLAFGRAYGPLDPISPDASPQDKVRRL